MPRKSEFSKRPKKKMLVLMYIANRPMQIARWRDLKQYFVVERKLMSERELAVYLSRLAREGLIKRAWLGSGKGKERIYRINEYFFEELRKSISD
jgi:DNA-binding PadR family transcriptional regulator